MARTAPNKRTATPAHSMKKKRRSTTPIVAPVSASQSDASASPSTTRQPRPSAASCTSSSSSVDRAVLENANTPRPTTRPTNRDVSNARMPQTVDAKPSPRPSPSPQPSPCCSFFPPSESVDQEDENFPRSCPARLQTRDVLIPTPQSGTRREVREQRDVLAPVRQLLYNQQRSNDYEEPAILMVISLVVKI